MNTNTIYNILIIAIAVMLMIAAVIDIRKMKISRGFILILLLICFAAVAFKENYRIYDAIGGLFIGFCAIGVSMISNEQIGRGDGMIIASVGIVLGFRECLMAVCMSSVIMCAVAILALAFKKANKHTRLPFLPAIWVGYVMCAFQIMM